MPSISPCPFRSLTRKALALTGALAFIFAGQTVRLDAATTPAAQSDLHSFTNDSGAEFKGQILSVVGDDVSIKREDGQTFRPKISVFSKADQKYIRSWVASNAKAHGADLFTIHAASGKGVTTTTSADPKTKLAATLWKESYQLGIKNLSSANLNTLHVRYIVFKLNANPSQLPPDDYTEQKFPGSVEVDKLAGNEEKSFALDKVDMEEQTLTGYAVWANGAPKTATDKLKGIWVRVYDQDENLLQEWVSNPDILKSEAWVFNPSLAKEATLPNLSRPYSNAPRGSTAAPPAKR